MNSNSCVTFGLSLKENCSFMEHMYSHIKLCTLVHTIPCFQYDLNCSVLKYCFDNLGAMDKYLDLNERFITIFSKSGFAHS